MSESSNPNGENLSAMSQAELAALGGRMDGVETVFKEDRWPVPGTRAEKRSERLVSFWLMFGGLMGLLLLLVFLFWPCLLYTSPSPRDRS